MLFIVTNTNDNGVGSLRQAIATAQSGDIINFNLPNDSTINLTSGQLDIPTGKNLVIDGKNIDNLTISGNNNSRIFNLNSSEFRPNSLTLKNLKLTRGFALEGGAINIAGDSSNVVIDNVTFNDNVATKSGGAIFTAFKTDLTVVNSKFNRNISTAGNDEKGAGAISFWGPNKLTVRNSEFTENRGINGGAIYSLNGKLLIDDCKFIRNTTTDAKYGAAGTLRPQLKGYGGAICTDRASSQGEASGYIGIFHSVFEGNTARNGGGATSLYTGNQDRVTIDSSSFENNQVFPLTPGDGSGNGGAINQVNNGANQGFTVRNSTFANNSASGQGGAIWKNFAPTNIINTTFYGNKAVNSDNPSNTGVIGGAMLFTGPGNVINSTFANNHAGWSGGAIATDNQNLSVKNTIFSANTAANGLNNWKVGQNTNVEISNGQNNIQFPNRSTTADAYAVAGIQIIDPKLGPLQDNGGATKTMALLPGSGAIDAGTDVDTPTFDQRGKSRFIDGNGDGIAARDIGAFEVFTVEGLSPEIQVIQNGNDIADGSLTPVDFGRTNVGSPVNKTFTIANTGTDTLVLNDLLLPLGFSLAGSFPASLLPGEQTDLVIRLNAEKSGNPNGDIYFTNNDSDENPFSFAVTAKIVGLINGTAANDLINCTLADEVVNGLESNDTINGYAGDDTINGGSGNDILNGGSGINIMIGETGNDNYTVESSLDVIVETSTVPTEIDIVNSAVSYSLGLNLENLTLSGTTAINGTGNSVNNLINANNGNNVLRGGLGNDSLFANLGNDSLVGDLGNDNLNGGGGNDSLNGGSGNDSYNVDSAADVVIETSIISTEIDTVSSAVNYSLGANLENLFISGTAINATGNQANNYISGNSNNNVIRGGNGNDVIVDSVGNDSLIGEAGNDNLNGGAGNDNLNGDLGNDYHTGGLGQDAFAFNSPNQGVDTVSDFNPTDDTITVLRSGFGGGTIAVGSIATEELSIGTLAGSSQTRFIYNPVNGNLWFDIDGTGSTTAIQFAILSNKPSINNTDIVIV